VLVLAKAMLAMMIGFILAIVSGLILIPLFKKIHVGQQVSLFVRKHLAKQGIPTMGGFIFIIPTLLTIFILLFMGRLEWSNNLLIILFVFLSYGLLGFVDDFIKIKKGNNGGLKEITKLFVQLAIAMVFFYIYIKSGHDAELYIHTLGVRIEFGWLYGFFILFMLVASSNAVNITDGLDGLAGGLSLIAFLALGLVSWNSTWIVGYEEIAIFCFILVGSLLGYLFFNTHPAKIIMGDTGSLALGATMASIAILTKHEVTFIIIAGVFIIETLTVIIQWLSLYFTGKKVFLMAPLHHHFEKLGWEESDIVKTFWVVGIILAMAAVLFAVWI
jgi:phospho-N-acetylmuramoyl-pentapeptide-transferase